jgi:hypothetical protein
MVGSFRVGIEGKRSHRRCGNVGNAKRFPRAVGSGGKPARSAHRVSDGGFPPLSTARHFHSAPGPVRRVELQVLRWPTRTRSWRLARCIASAASVSD